MVGLGNTSWQKVPQVNYVLIISQVPLKKNLHPSNRKSLPPFGFSRLRGSLTLAVGGGIDKVVKNPATHVVCVKWSILQLPSCSIEIWELQRFKVPRSDPSRFEMQTELLSGMCSSPWSIFPRQQRSHCACGWVGGCNGWGMRWAGANRSTGLYSPEILSKLLSHHQSKLLNAFCIWRECSETVLWSMPSHGLGFTPHLGWSNHQLLLRSVAGSLSPAHRHPFLPFSLCWDRVAAHRHISSLSNQSIRTGADPVSHSWHDGRHGVWAQGWCSCSSSLPGEAESRVSLCLPCLQQPCLPPRADAGAPEAMQQVRATWSSRNLTWPQNKKQKKYIHSDGNGSLTGLSMQPANTTAGAREHAGTHWRSKGESRKAKYGVRFYPIGIEKSTFFFNFWTLHLENCKHSSSVASSLGFAQHTAHRCRSIGKAQHSPELFPQALSVWMWGGKWVPAAVQIKGALQRQWKQHKGFQRHEIIRAQDKVEAGLPPRVHRLYLKSSETSQVCWVPLSGGSSLKYVGEVALYRLESLTWVWETRQTYCPC